MANRPIDKAMGSERPEKQKIREKWINVVSREQSASSTKDRPLYVTLPGADGKDIELLIKNGILSRTENGAISSDDQWKVIAIEKNGPAAGKLRRRFPGLDVRNDDVLNLIHGHNETTFPDSNHDDYKIWTAHVINLDYNSRFKGSLENGRGLYDVPQTLKKISTIQHEEKNARWSILLTLNANIKLDPEFWSEIKETLNDNFKSVEKFQKDFTKIIPLGADNQLSCDVVSKIQRYPSLQQKLIIALVPKFFIQKIRDHRWEITEIQSFVYGNNTRGRARMSSWIIVLEKPKKTKTDERCYLENVSKILNDCFQLQDDGNMVTLS